MTNGTDAAFSLSCGEGPFNPGLTKREYFAAMAMQGLIASTLPVADISPEMYAAIPRLALFAADDLIRALNQEKTSL